MTRETDDFHDVITYIYDRCGTEHPSRSETEIKDYLRNRHGRWDYGEDVDSSESGLHHIVNEMFESGWIWGKEEAA